MKKHISNKLLFFCFCALTGAIIAGVIWAYLKIANLGITLIWDVIPGYLNIKYYTIVVCLIGGLVVGIFHKAYGPYPESMADSINRVKVHGTYPYSRLPMTTLAALLSLFFGGAVGPESGLVCILLGMCFWAMDQFGMGREVMEDLVNNDPNISRKYVFKKMCRGLLYRARKIVYNKDKIIWKKSEQISAGVVTGLTALLVYEILNTLLGRGLSVPHLEQQDMYTRDRVGMILMIVVGIGSGYLFLIFRKITRLFFDKLRLKNLHIVDALLGAAVLGIIGTFLPMTMFSGGSDIQVIQYEYLSYTPVLLIVIGVVKLFLTNVCIESGWRGGHFFPVIFSGLSIGYGLSILLNTNQILCVVIVTTSLLATMMQQPIGAIVLSLIFFPLREVGWMIVAGMIGGCIPVPKPLRNDPENKGFIYNMIHMKPYKRIAQKDM